MGSLEGGAFRQGGWRGLTLAGRSRQAKPSSETPLVFNVTDVSLHYGALRDSVQTGSDPVWPVTNHTVTNHT